MLRLVRKPDILGRCDCFSDRHDRKLPQLVSIPEKSESDPAGNSSSPEFIFPKQARTDGSRSQISNVPSNSERASFASLICLHLQELLSSDNMCVKLVTCSLRHFVRISSAVSFFSVAAASISSSGGSASMRRRFQSTSRRQPSDPCIVMRCGPDFIKCLKLVGKFTRACLSARGSKLTIGNEY